MQIAGGACQDGVVIGNTFDKYGSGNPIVKRLMSGFENALTRFVENAAPKSIHEVGCGEGYWATRWTHEGYRVRGTDFSSEVISLAKSYAATKGHSPDFLEVKSIYDVSSEKDSADLVVCCEVLEHLEEPEKALQALSRLDSKSLILSVPSEPLWRILNMTRGKYLSEFGNTPGHIQHWSKSGIVNLVSRTFDIVEVVSPLPWTMIHCKRRMF